mgnify:CR=1 FL=1
MTITLNHYLLVSGLLFAIGFAGVLLRRNIITIFMCLELMLNAANLSLVAFSRFNVGPDGLPNYNAQVLVFFIITVAAAEVAVGLAIIVAIFRRRRSGATADDVAEAVPGYASTLGGARSTIHVPLLKNDEIAYIVNTTEGRQAINDSSIIRRTALARKVPYATTLAGANAVCMALEYGREITVRRLQDLHAGATQ